MIMESMKEKNRELNDSEINAGKYILDSTPQYVTIGAHYGCNAKCVFCLGGDYPRFTMRIYRELFEKKLSDVLKRADHVGYCGYGEILLMPEILEFLAYLNDTLPETQKVFTTNGIPLKPKICEYLIDGRYSVLISLHASNKELHRSLVGVSAFDQIIENIRYAVRLRKSQNRILHINLIFLLSSMNLHDLPDFIRLASRLEVDRVTCNYLTIFSPEQVKMSCYFQKDLTNSVFDESQELAEKLGITLVLPPRFNQAKHADDKQFCRDPWEFFYVETQGSVVPCCYAGDHIGYLNKDDFNNIWNAEGYISLRKGLIEDNPHEWCRFCCKYKKSNIDDIRAHITSRPETRKEITDYIEGYKNSTQV